MALRTVIEGDEFWTSVTESAGPDGQPSGRYDVVIFRHNPNQFEDVPLRDGRSRQPASPQVIWGRQGFPSREAALNAARATALTIGLGSELEDRSEGPKDDSGESHRGRRHRASGGSTADT